MGWFNDTMSWVGKAMPNELSKLNSYSKYLQYIPYVGQAASVIMKAGATVDNFATAYDDTRDRGGSETEAWSRALGGAMDGVQGTSRDPGMYGSPNINRDWANTAGQIGNYLPGGADTFKGNFTAKNMMGSNPMGKLQSLGTNPYFWGQEKGAENAQAMGNLGAFFGGQQQQQQPQQNYYGIPYSDGNMQPAQVSYGLPRQPMLSSQYPLTSDYGAISSGLKPKSDTSKINEQKVTSKRPEEDILDTLITNEALQQLGFGGRLMDSGRNINAGNNIYSII